MNGHPICSIIGLLAAIALVFGTVENSGKLICVKENNFTEPVQTTNQADDLMLSSVNLEREKALKNDLVMSPELNRCAEIRLQEIAQNFSHTRPDGRAFNTVLSDNGVSFKNWGENVAMGQTSLSEAMEDWMNSPDHRSNILSEKYTFTKFGSAAGNIDGVDYWVQIFISE